MSRNYVTWYLVETFSRCGGIADTRICHKEKERDAWIAEMCEKYERAMDKPVLQIRIDRHAVPNGPLM